MPTYEYRCDACDHEFELFQQMSDPVKRKCPKCGKSKLQRLIGTGSGIIFKGGGFYQTDYRSEGYKKSAEAEKKSLEPAKDSTSKSDTTTKTAEAATAATETKSQPKQSETPAPKKKPKKKE